MSATRLPVHVFGAHELTPKGLVAIAEGRAAVALSDDAAYVARLDAGHEAVLRRLRSGLPVYGVSTGFGASCENRVALEHAADLARHLVRYHGCGTGGVFTPEESAAIVAARIASLAGGYSGLRHETLRRLVDLLKHGVLPVIPREGSVGASGDLTPLSYVAAVLVGEREAYLRGRIVPATEALAAAGLAPWELGPKESLALMNGTSVMAALACLVHGRAERYARLACALTAFAVEVLRGRPEHFDARIFAAKPHAGQVQAASWIRRSLAVPDHPAPGSGRLQDRYSIRCAPHVVGVLVDALAFAEPVLHVEVNGANDNPLVDVATGDVLHGGNFYGGHVTFVLDAVKTALASTAELLERQLVQLLHPVTSNGLPENLVAATGTEASAHHGFKAMEITASALVAEALKLTMPAASFSRSTEGHNQDKVPMGPIAARDALRILDLAETVAAIHLLALAQAADLRGGADTLRGEARALHRVVRERVPTVAVDRRQDRDIDHVLSMIRSDALPLP